MRAIVTRFGYPRIKGMIDKQKSITNLPGVLYPTSLSPIRFEIPFEILKLMQDRNDLELKRAFPIRRILSVLKNIGISVDSISTNPVNPLVRVTSEFLDELREFIQSQGIVVSNFTRLPRNLIFQEFGVLYHNAIILAMEMDQERIEKAPSKETMTMVFETYDNLGIVANRIASFLRDHGFAAQADHPLGGLVLFPPLAQSSGIGWIGRHGLLITPEFGPRVRLAAVYTSIQNLPFAEKNDHDWIEKYCQMCGACIKQCPSNAILGNVIVHDNDLISFIEQRTCFEYFAQFYGCSVCIKACPFSKGIKAYKQLRQMVEE
jgi:epoxyqueuosine reductase